MSSTSTSGQENLPYWFQALERRRRLGELGELHHGHPKELAPGDHLYVWRKLGTYSHHGIYVGEWEDLFSEHPDVEASYNENGNDFYPRDKIVIHLTIHGTDGPQIRMDTLDRFAAEGEVKIVQYNASLEVYGLKRGGVCSTAAEFEPKKVIERAVSGLGDSNYDLVELNCECFASDCKCGIIISHQSSFYTFGSNVQMRTAASISGATGSFTNAWASASSRLTTGMTALQSSWANSMFGSVSSASQSTTHRHSSKKRHVRKSHFFPDWFKPSNNIAVIVENWMRQSDLWARRVPLDVILCVSVYRGYSSKWSESFRGSRMQTITDNCAQCTISKFASLSWQGNTIRAHDPLPPKGIHEFSVTYKGGSTSLGPHHVVGVMSGSVENVDLRMYSKSIEYSTFVEVFGVDSNRENGCKYLGSRIRRDFPTEGFCKDQEITVRVDCDQHTLTFFVDGERMDSTCDEAKSFDIQLPPGTAEWYPFATVWTDAVCCILKTE